MRAILFGTIASLAIGASFGAQAAVKISPAEKAMLQASMYQYIDRQTIDGNYLHLDQKTGDVKKLVPEKAHPMIFQMGEFFVLCSDFRDAEGKQVNIDFFMAKRGNNFMVFDRFVDNRAPVMKLYNDGKAVDVE